MVLCCALLLLVAASAFARGALVKVDDIILRADGGFQPRTLPRHQFAPIDFHGYFDIAAKGGGKPVVLREAAIAFDSDGRLHTAGLPTCPASRIANVGVAAARDACHGAIVGNGRIEALIDLPGGLVPATSPLTIFNGPRQGGQATVVLHAAVPGSQVFAIVVPIERRPGAFRYRATLAFPEIAGGRGAITRVEAKVGRRFVAGGQRRSYVSARCSEGILQTHGRFTFADGTIIEGSVEKGCTPR